MLERCLGRLSPGAAAQAVVTMHADVEWRRVSALATAWEIYASEEHLKFLHMVLEDEGEEYANASQEPLGVSVQELVRSNEKVIKEQIDCSVTAYSDDIALFSVGDTQLDYLENARMFFLYHVSNVAADDQLKVTDVTSDSDNSGVALTNSEEDRFQTTSKLGGSADAS